MSEMYKWPIGWSDHSRIKVVISAVLKWDVVVEMHLDLDGDGEEFGLGIVGYLQTLSKQLKYARHQNL